MPLTLAAKLLYSTTKIRVLTESGKAWSGTGFFINLKPNQDEDIYFIISNKHVLVTEENAQIEIAFHLDDGCHMPSKKSIAIKQQILKEYLVEHPDKDVDLCAYCIGPIINSLSKQNIEVFIQCIETDLIPKDFNIFDSIEDVIMIGYPQGIADEVNNLPIVRRGITATPLNNDYYGKKMFVIDMACFPGSSGSPVYIYNNGNYIDPRYNARIIGNRKLFLLGILFSGPIIKDHALDKNKNLNENILIQKELHLGYVIKSEEILKLKAKIAKSFNIMLP